MTLRAPPVQHCAFSTFLISRCSAEVEAALPPARVTFFEFRVVGAEVEAALTPARDVCAADGRFAGASFRPFSGGKCRIKRKKYALSPQNAKTARTYYL